MLFMFMARMGSRNQMDAQRNSGDFAASIARLAGRDADDMPSDGKRYVTCSDNAVRYLKELPTEELENIQVHYVQKYLKGRIFDGSRVCGRYYPLVIDGSVREKCRKKFEGDGKSNGSGKYRYVLQASLLLNGLPIPILQEHMDVVDPVTEKEDCEINASKRLLPRIRKLFPRLEFVVIGDALYACRPIAALCSGLNMRFSFTFKEGRTPAVWKEAITLMDLEPLNSLEFQDQPDASPNRRAGRVRWAHHIDFSEKEDGSLMATAIEQTETHRGVTTRYAWISDLPGIKANNVLSLVHSTGRMRHTIEDLFNTAKNNGVGMEHVFCAQANASKNLYTLMQMALMLWCLFCHGVLRRACTWARKWPQLAIAKLLPESLRLLAGADPGFKVGQLRFVT